MNLESKTIWRAACIQGYDVTKKEPCKAFFECGTQEALMINLRDHYDVSFAIDNRQGVHECRTFKIFSPDGRIREATFINGVPNMSEAAISAAGFNPHKGEGD